MQSVGLPENLWAVDRVMWRVFGGSQVHGSGGVRKRKKGVDGGGSSTLPTHPVQSCPIKELRAGGVDVDYNGGASCRKADVRVCGGEG